MNYQEIFEDYYQDMTGVPFYLDAKEAACLKKLRERIIWYLDKKGHSNCADEFIDKKFKGFLYTITDTFVRENLVPSMILRQWNILLAQAEGKEVKDRSQIYKPIKTNMNDEKREEERLIRERYKTIHKENERTRGDKLRLVVQGDSTPTTSAKVVVTTLAEKYTKDNEK